MRCAVCRTPSEVTPLAGVGHLCPGCLAAIAPAADPTGCAVAIATELARQAAGKEEAP